MLQLSVHDTETGRLLAQICIALATIPDILPPPMPASEAQGMDAIVPPQIAGRIEASEHPFHTAIGDWSKHLRSRGKRDSSIKAFASVIRAAVLQQAWHDPNDASWKAVTDYMAAKRADETWKGSTYNRNLSAFRSFSRWWASAHGVRDPLTDLQRAEDDGEDGARAATLDEVRRLIAHARMRQGDARSKGNRALYWYAMFAAGCRHSEPSRWRWRHLVIDSDCPFIDWTREIQKNKRHMPTGISLRLAELLRAHRHTVPHDEDDRVFPIVPPRQTFRADRDAVGIPEKDVFGEPFSAGSFRKAFSTVLTGQGVADKMVDRLMRHAGRPEHRYYKPPMKEQVKCASQMPDAWALTALDPENLDTNSKIPVADRGGNPYIHVRDLNGDMNLSSHTHNSTSARMVGEHGSPSGRAEASPSVSPAIPADFGSLRSSGNAEYRPHNSRNSEHNRPLPVHDEPVSLILTALAKVPTGERRDLLLKIAAILSALALAIAWGVWHFTRTAPPPPLADTPIRTGR